MNNLKKAYELCNKYPVVDAHLDLPYEIFLRKKIGEKNIIKSRYLTSFKKAGIKIVIGAIFSNPFFDSSTELKNALNQINEIKKEINKNEDIILIKAKKDIEKVLSSDKIGIILSLEGLEPIGSDISLLETFYDLGVRAAGLVWSRRNMIGDGASFDSNPDNRVNGLSEIGKKAVLKIKELGMILDISHLNDQGSKDVFKYDKISIIASHSNSRANNNINRNLNDDSINAIKNVKGVIGINVVKSIIGKCDNYIAKICDHIDYIREKIGIDYIGFGFDFCNGIVELKPRFENIENIEKIDALNSHEEIIYIIEELLNRDYNEDEISKILGGNFINLLKNSLK